MKTIKQLRKKDFKDAIDIALNGGHTSVAPLGMSGDTILLHNLGEKKSNGCYERVQQVSIRLYCGDPELLITNNKGSFLFYGRYDIRMGRDFILKEYYRIFKLLRKQIPLEHKEKDLTINEDAKQSIGFAILNKLLSGRL